jgi:hypothetical protein
MEDLEIYIIPWYEEMHINMEKGGGHSSLAKRDTSAKLP